MTRCHITSYYVMSLLSYLKRNNNNSMLACRVVCCSHQSDRRIWVFISHQKDCCMRACISHQTDFRIRVCISHKSHNSIWISCTPAAFRVCISHPSYHSFLANDVIEPGAVHLERPHTMSLHVTSCQVTHSMLRDVML